MIYCSQNRFDANIQAFFALLYGDSLLMVYSAFAVEFEIFMLLITAHCETALSGRRCHTPTEKQATRSVS
ncbi:MAG: hypothetical protein V7L29_33335 [Nostoc sp.]|uniref:hypothetical protein n=1 Tax=Nostoc sp. TaxID=1180 RepID=UPI002FEF7CA1